MKLQDKVTTLVLTQPRVELVSVYSLRCFESGSQRWALMRCSHDGVEDFKLKETNLGHCLFNKRTPDVLGLCVCPAVSCACLHPITQHAALNLEIHLAHQWL